jgi:hypothetical protein
MRALVLLFALAAPLAFAAEESVRLDAAPIDPRDIASLQAGAKTFVNYCLNCHAAGMMRYHKLLEIGLTEQQIKDNLLFTADKVGELMNVAMTRRDAKEWLGTVPPDLSVIARARGPDWLYTYLRSFYRDRESATGWNNMVYERVAMPHVLWMLSGQQAQVERRFKTMEQAENRQAAKNAWKIDVPPEQADRTRALRAERWDRHSRIAVATRIRPSGPRPGQLHDVDVRAQSVGAQAGGLRGPARAPGVAGARVPPLQGVLEGRALKGVPSQGAGAGRPRLFHLQIIPNR